MNERKIGKAKREVFDDHQRSPRDDWRASPLPPPPSLSDPEMDENEDAEYVEYTTRARRPRLEQGEEKLGEEKLGEAERGRRPRRQRSSRRVTSLPLEKLRVKSMCVSPTCDRLACAVIHDTSDILTVQIWSARREERIATMISSGDGTAICFSADGKYLAIGEFMLVRVVSAATGETVARLRRERDAIAAAFCPTDSNILATVHGDSRVVLWDISLETSTEYRQIVDVERGDRIFGIKAWVSFCVGSSLLVAFNDGPFYLLDAVTLEIQEQVERGDLHLQKASVFQNGRRLATLERVNCEQQLVPSGQTRAVCVADLAPSSNARIMGIISKTVAIGAFVDVSCSTDGSLLACSHSLKGGLEIRHSNGTLKQAVDTGQHKPQFAVFAPNDDNLVYTCGADGTLRAWNVAANACILNSSLEYSVSSDICNKCNSVDVSQTSLGRMCRYCLSTDIVKSGVYQWKDIDYCVHGASPLPLVVPPPISSTSAQVRSLPRAGSERAMPIDLASDNDEEEGADPGSDLAKSEREKP